MKILIIIYIISWLILLVMHISDFLSRKKKKTATHGDTPWYIYVIFILFAPLVVLMIPGFMIADSRKKKKSKWRAQKYKEKDKTEAKETASQKKANSDEEIAKRNAEDRILAAKKETARINYLSSEIVEDNYTINGKKIHALVKEKHYDSISKHLNEMSFPLGTSLFIKECPTDETFGESEVMVKLPNGNLDKNIFDYITVEQSGMGAWQAYLLHTLWHSLPLCWHSNYFHQDFIFEKDDIKNLRFYPNHHVDLNELSRFDVSPEVRMNNNKFYISCCFWSNFRGLIRERYEIIIKDHKIVDLFNYENEILYPFNCGIRF